MKKNKYIIIALVCILLSPFLYKYFLYYKIPNNPLVKLSSDAVSCSFTEIKYDPEEYKHHFNYHSLDCSVIFNYLKDLKLKPLKNEDYSSVYDIIKPDYYYSIKLSEPDWKYDLNIKLWLKDLSVIYINCNKPGFKSGFYKLIDSEFDYKYLNDLILLQS